MERSALPRKILQHQLGQVVVPVAVWSSPVRDRLLIRLLEADIQAVGCARRGRLCGLAFIYQ